ncbi:MAG TPA: DUF2784 domain-containing protein [Steroidobacteraceae bacterium]|nr:DUF2784 domain-containing protein [Steroidobacteraceae bacterium]
MLYRALADAVLVLHLAFILFVMLGGLLVLRLPWLAWLHLPAAIWGALIEFAGWICPLTPLEKQLRLLAGEEAYRGGFINHYVIPLIYPDGLTREMQWLLGVLVLAVNAAVYLRFWRKRQAARG